MALCSLSIGNSSAPLLEIADMKMSPAITKASLLANKIRLPSFAASMVGTKPAAPTMAAITVSTDVNVEAETKASAP